MGVLAGCEEAGFAAVARRQNVPPLEISEVERLAGTTPLFVGTPDEVSQSLGSAVSLDGKHVVALRLVDASTPRLGRLLLPELRSLEVIRSHLVSLDGLGRSARLETLRVPENVISSLDGLESLPRLRALDVSHNPLASLGGLPALPALEELTATDGSVTRLDDLADRPTLRVLDLARQKLASLQSLPPLPGLKVLVLDGNPLSSIDGAQRAPALESVSLKQTTGLVWPLPRVPRPPDTAPPALEEPLVKDTPVRGGTVTSVSKRGAGTSWSVSGVGAARVLDSKGSAPHGRLKVKVEKGKVRASLDSPSGEVTCDAEPGRPCEVKGVLRASKSRKSKGVVLPSWEVTLEALDGKATGVKLEFTPDK